MVGADEQDLTGLVAAINADPNPLHVDFTPAVMRLIDLGLDAAEAVLPLLVAPDAMTRLRARRVLEGVVMRRHGWVAGRGYRDAGSEAAAQHELAAIGDEPATTAPATHAGDIGKWRVWLDASRRADAAPLRP